ncbi:peptidyl-tRNA hydrolase [Mytilinidion resinicola]|uniref:peptidyl-tRNA hydrolase n=1 Tax=Mytilinidion resinicola TaxID=574789 RepID=A0A6A6YRQ9_9PEZI|nr:peptidyl-tRNA hydrolase [Mytilinidion resinicola]KAF2811490.1 peptidyl-tRNA hydrolase [Mytilinidion resinicola]
MSPTQEPARGPSREGPEKIVLSETPAPPSTNPPTSRRERRQARKRRDSAANPRPTRTRKASINHPKPRLPLSTVSTIPPEMSAARKTIPLLVASIGNPEAAYANTLHSAGHTVLNRVSAIRCFGPFTANKRLGGQVSEPIRTTTFNILPFVNKTREVEVADDWTLWKSPSLMNVSGKAVKSAWEAFRRNNPDGLLVVVHDELEKKKGEVTVKRGGSAKGHNGIKSVVASMGGTPFVRIGVGIGRPLSREPSVIVKYVLKKMTPEEQYEIESAAGPVIEALRDVAEGLR